MKKTILLFITFLSFSSLFSQEDVKEITPLEEVFTVVETMPVFNTECDKVSDSFEQAKCTSSAIQQYAASINYPQIAIDKDIQGKVYISFVVERDGSVSEVTLLRGTNKILDKAAMNHIKNIPTFLKPGVQRGKPVRVKYNIPINFKLGYKENKPLTKRDAKRMRKDTRKKLKALKKKN